MSGGAETAGRHMPPAITLDDLTAMMTADEHHQYEISPEGMLTVEPPAGYAHAIIATRTVDQDPAQTVTMYQLDADRYQARATMPLAWALNTGPAEHDLG